MTDKTEDMELEEIMEMISDNDAEETSTHQQSPDDSVDREAPESEEPKEQSRDAKLLYETTNANLQLKQELERVKAEKDEAERVALQSVLKSYESTIDSTNYDMDRLKGELVRARDEGDTAATVEIESRIRENHDKVRELKGKYDQYSPLLNKQSQTQSNAPAQAEGNKMAKEWLQDNEAWLTDPSNADKRDFANNLFKEMQSNRMDMSSLSFWTKFEKQLNEYDNKKSDKNQHRMPKNMVTYNSNGSNSGKPRPDNYKKNPEFVQKVAFLAKNVIKNEDMLKNPEMLNSLLRHYHKVYKAGNFKHLPTTYN